MSAMSSDVTPDRVPGWCGHSSLGRLPLSPPSQFELNDVRSRAGDVQLLPRRVARVSPESIPPSALSPSQGATQRELEELRARCAELTKERDELAESKRELEEERESTYEKFGNLKAMYNDLKAEMHRVLWECVPSLSLKSGDGGCKENIGRNGGGSGIGSDNVDWFNFKELARVDHGLFETPNRVGDYVIGELLGDGTFAKVRLCTHASTRRRAAAKIMPKRAILNLAGLRRIQYEIGALREVNHPNIVKLVEVINSPECIYVLTEMGGKELFKYYEHNTCGVDNAVARQILLGITRAVVHLHGMGICHRDLKPENVLLFERSDGSISHRDVRICDLGECARVNAGGESCTGEQTLTKLCGSPGFFAPEMIFNREEGYCGLTADIWSLGCITLELTRGHGEFCKSWMTSYVKEKNVDKKAVIEEVYWDRDRFRALLRGAVGWARKTARGGEGEVVMLDFLMGLLTIDPEERTKSHEALSHPWLADVAVEVESINAKENPPKEPAEPMEVDPCEVETPAGAGAASGGEDLASPDAATGQLQAEATSSLKTAARKSKRNLFHDSPTFRARKHFAGSDQNGDKVVIASDSDWSPCGGADDGCAGMTSEAANALPCQPIGSGTIEIRLPPIGPRAMSFKEARRMLLEKDRIMFLSTRGLT